MTVSALTRPGERDRLIVKFSQIDWTFCLALCLIAGAGALGTLLWLIPQCVGGPYAEIDPLLAEKWLPKISEAHNALVMFGNSPVLTVYYFILPITGFAIATFLLLGKDSTRADFEFLNVCRVCW